MKTIKVFIASSAELDDDKTQFDIYFNRKNKEYNNKYITFEHRTWRDFPSYLGEEHLQLRYDEYIRKCDIVIFLFHIRIGQYTLHELKVAFDEVKKNGKKPKVYIYARRDEFGENILEQLKTYSEQEYGHFCDTYAGYDELFRHFDYQLSQLEKEGFIRPNPVDLPRTLRFVLLSLLPVALAAISIIAYQLWQPSSIRVELKETVSTKLPFKGGTVTLKYAGIEETKQVAGLADVIEFEGISKKYCWFEPFSLTFSSNGFIQKDTTFSFVEELQLPVRRDGKAGIFRGVVTDEDRIPVGDATVKVLTYSANTAPDGTFTIEIPLSEQAVSYRLSVYKPGYEVWDYNGVAASGDEMIRIALRR